MLLTFTKFACFEKWLVTRAFAFKGGVCLVMTGIGQNIFTFYLTEI